MYRILPLKQHGNHPIIAKKTLQILTTEKTPIISIETLYPKNERLTLQ